MKAAILSEFSAIKNVLLQQFAIYLIVGLVIGISMGTTIAMVACISAMAPILMVFTFAGYDNMNGWERFRATLPVARESLVIARYLNVLISSIATLVVAFVIAMVLGQLSPVLPLDAESVQTIADEMRHPLTVLGGGFAGMSLILMFSSLLQPFILRYGLTKALRWIPAALMVLFLGVTLILPEVIDAPQFIADFASWMESPDNIPVVIAGLAAITLGVYCISCAGAIALYRKKEL